MNDFLLAAHHEAAHAVVALRMGIPLYSITLGQHAPVTCDLPGYVPGQAVVGAAWSEGLAVGSVWRGTTAYARVLLDIAQAVAGVTAECRIAGASFSSRLRPGPDLYADDYVNAVELSLLLAHKPDIDPTIATAHAIAALVIARQWASIRWLARQVVASDGNYRTTDAGLGIACELCPRASAIQALIDLARHGAMCDAERVAAMMDARLDHMGGGQRRCGATGARDAV